MSDFNVNIDYQAVLADLKEKRDKIDAAIAGIETMLGFRTLDKPGTPTETMAQLSQALGPGAFLGMTIVDAAVKLLRAKRRNMRTDEILSELKAGGLSMTSSNPINTVGSVLLRDWQQDGEIVRVERGLWGLAEWHPRLRKRALERNGASTLPMDEQTSEEPDNEPTAAPTGAEALRQFKARPVAEQTPRRRLILD